jgi:hypothetical protein
MKGLNKKHCHSISLHPPSRDKTIFWCSKRFQIIHKRESSDIRHVVTDNVFHNNNDNNNDGDDDEGTTNIHNKSSTTTTSHQRNVSAASEKPTMMNRKSLSTVNTTPTPKSTSNKAVQTPCHYSSGQPS